MAKFLIDEPPMMFQPSLAVAIGDREAIFIQKVHYWVNAYREMKDEDHYFDGHWWMYNTVQQWQTDNFPFWSESTIKRIIAHLEELKILISVKRDRKDWDHKKWYRIDYNALDALIENRSAPVSEEDNDESVGPKVNPDQVKLTQSIGSKRSNRSGQNGPISITQTTSSQTTPQTTGNVHVPLSEEGITTEPHPWTAHPVTNLLPPTQGRIYAVWQYSPPRELLPIDTESENGDNNFNQSSRRKSLFGRTGKRSKPLDSMFTATICKAAGIEGGLSPKQQTLVNEIYSAIKKEENAALIEQRTAFYPSMAYVNELILWMYNRGMAIHQWVAAVRNEANWVRFTEKSERETGKRGYDDTDYESSDLENLG